MPLGCTAKQDPTKAPHAQAACCACATSRAHAHARAHRHAPVSASPRVSASPPFPLPSAPAHLQAAWAARSPPPQVGGTRLARAV